MIVHTLCSHSRHMFIRKKKWQDTSLWSLLPPKIFARILRIYIKESYHSPSQIKPRRWQRCWPCSSVPGIHDPWLRGRARCRRSCDGPCGVWRDGRCGQSVWHRDRKDRALRRNESVGVGPARPSDWNASHSPSTCRRTAFRQCVGAGGPSGARLSRRPGDESNRDYCVFGKSSRSVCVYCIYIYDATTWLISFVYIYGIHTFVIAKVAIDLKSILCASHRVRSLPLRSLDMYRENNGPRLLPGPSCDSCSRELPELHQLCLPRRSRSIDCYWNLKIAFIVMQFNHIRSYTDASMIIHLKLCQDCLLWIWDRCLEPVAAPQAASTEAVVSAGVDAGNLRSPVCKGVFAPGGLYSIPCPDTTRGPTPGRSARLKIVEL